MLRRPAKYNGFRRSGHFTRVPKSQFARKIAGVLENGPENSCSKSGQKGQKGINLKSVCKKFHSEAETASKCAKTAARAVHVMKTMLQAAYSGYFTSAASEMSAQKGQKGIKGDKCCVTKFHSEAETAC